MDAPKSATAPKSTFPNLSSPFEKKLTKWEGLPKDSEKLKNKLNFVITDFFQENSQDHFIRQYPDLCLRFSQLLYRTVVVIGGVADYSKVIERFARAAVFSPLDRNTPSDLTLIFKGGTLPGHKMIFGLRNREIRKTINRVTTLDFPTYSERVVSILRNYFYTAQKDISSLTPKELVELSSLSDEIQEQDLHKHCLDMLELKATKITTLEGLKEFQEVISATTLSGKNLAAFSLEAFFKNNGVALVPSTHTPGSYLLGCKRLDLLEAEGEVGELVRKHVCGIFVEYKFEEIEAFAQVHFLKKGTKAKIQELSLPESYVWNLSADMLSELRRVIYRVDEATVLDGIGAAPNFIKRKMLHQLQDRDNCKLVLQIERPRPFYTLPTLESSTQYLMDLGETFSSPERLENELLRSLPQFDLYEIAHKSAYLVFKKKAII